MKQTAFNLIKKIIPWIFAIGLFGYLFTKVTMADLVMTFKIANLWLFALFSILYFFVIHTFDCLCMQQTISRFATPISFKETWVVRGVSYLIMVLNYHAAQGAFAIYFKKTHGAKISKTLGALFFITAIDLLIVAGFALAAALYQKSNSAISKWITLSVPFLYVGFVVWLAFWKATKTTLMSKLKKYKAVAWVLNHDIFKIFREVKLIDIFKLLAYRIPMIFVVIGGYYLGLRSFGANIDLIDIYVYNPVVMFVSTLPITPSGLGTSQLLVIEFFQNRISSPWIDQGLVTPASLLLISSLLWFLANQVIKAIFGAISMSQTNKALFEDAEIQKQADALPRDPVEQP